MAKKTILVVDDEYLILNTVKDILIQEDYNVITALSGKEALKKLKIEKVDLAILDIMMPVMGGLELTKQIREDSKLKNIKIVYLSALTFSKNQKQKLKKYNILAYIQKPFEYLELIKIVDNIIRI